MYKTDLFRRMILISLAIGVLILPAIAQEPSRRDVRRSNDLVTDGNKAFNQRNYRNAIEKYAEAIVLVPRNAAAHFWKGVAHQRLQENAAAMTELNLAEQQGHAPVEVAKVRWLLHFEGKNFDAALQDAKIGLQATPSDQAMLRAVGDIQFEKKNYDESLASYTQALLGTPNDGTLYYAIARVQQARGDVKGQEDAATMAIARPNQYLTQSNILLADALHRQRKYGPAIAAYQKVLAADPNNIQTYRSMGDIYRALSRFPEAIDITRQAIRKWPQDGNLYTDISWYYSLNGDHAEAAETAKSATQLLPQQYMGFTNLCRAQNDLKQYASAIISCNSALRINPDDGETYFYLGRAYQQLNRTAEAAKAFDRAVPGLVKFTQENPDYSDGFYLLGNAYTENDSFEKALEAYRKCLELNPRFARAYYNSGAILVHLKRKEAAIIQYQALVSLDPELAGRLKAQIESNLGAFTPTTPVPTPARDTSVQDIKVDSAKPRITTKPVTSGESPFVSEYVGITNTVIRILNNAGRTLTVDFGGTKHVIEKDQERIIEADGGNYEFYASAPGARSTSGVQNFAKGYKYSWTFYIVTR